MGGETTGEILERLLTTKGLSQRKLAMLSGVDRGYINALIKGKRQNISLKTARKLAQALEVSPEIFLAEEALAPRKESSEELLDRFRITLPESVPIFEEFTLHAGRPVEPKDYMPVVRDRARSRDLEGYIVRGSSLSPMVEDGDVIIIDRDRQIDTGDIVACLIDGHLHLARLRKIAEELYLENNHGRYKLEEAQVAAPVIEVRRKLK